MIRSFLLALALCITLVGVPASAASAATDWEQRGGDIDGATAGDESGYSVALSADGLIVAVTSSYLLTIRNLDAHTSTRVLASGVVDARGNLEARILLPALEPASYDVVFEGKHRGGAGLRLTARLVVSSSGQIEILG